jgi:hypothetical protein
MVEVHVNSKSLLMHIAPLITCDTYPLGGPLPPNYMTTVSRTPAPLLPRPYP